jgi:hypothetical protein
VFGCGPETLAHVKAPSQGIPSAIGGEGTLVSDLQAGLQTHLPLKHFPQKSGYPLYSHPGEPLPRSQIAILTGRGVELLDGTSRPECQQL